MDSAAKPDGAAQTQPAPLSKDSLKGRLLTTVSVKEESPKEKREQDDALK
jgi:hypothetical protein